MYCKDCKFWELKKPHPTDSSGECDYGNCDHPNFNYEGPFVQSGLVYWDYEGYSAGFHTDKLFGCIHFAPKTTKDL